MSGVLNFEGAVQMSRGYDGPEIEDDFRGSGWERERARLFHEATVLAIAFSADGRSVMTAAGKDS